MNTIINDFLKVDVDQYGNITVTRLPDGMVWRSDIFERIPGIIWVSDGKSILLRDSQSINIINSDNKIFVTYKGFHLDDKIIEGNLTSIIEICNNDLTVTLQEFNFPQRIEAIEYPYKSFFVKGGTPDGYLALPYFEGTLLPAEDVVVDPVKLWDYYDLSRSAMGNGKIDPSMPFFGLRTNSGGFTAIAETGEDLALRYLVNSDELERFVISGEKSPFDRRLCAWPYWYSSMGELSYPRVIRYIFAESLNYVGMAKEYRKYAEKTGLIRTLKEKSKSLPQLDKIMGAPYIAYFAGYPHFPNHSEVYGYKYSDLKAAAVNLKKDGVEKAFIHFWGGFKIQPPGALPFDEVPGSLEELKQIVDSIHDMGYILTFYNDITAQVEEGTIWNRDYFGMTAAGSLFEKRYHRNCSSFFVNFANEIFPVLKNELGIKASYIDCMNGYGQPLMECYNPSHKMDRRKDRENRYALSRYIHSLDMIFGGENFTWWAMPEIEYLNGMGKWAGLNSLLNVHSIPLFHLVFHDCVIPFCHACDDYVETCGADLPGKILRDVLYGVPPMFFINIQDAAKWHQTIINTYNATFPVLRHTGYLEMTDHGRSPDGKYQEASFEDNKIYINLDLEERNGIPARSYKAVCEGQLIQKTFIQEFR